MKRKASTGDSSGAETAFCKKIKEDFDSSDDEIMYNSPKGRFSSTGINVSKFSRFLFEKNFNFDFN